MVLKRLVSTGATLLIVAGIAHAVHVGRADDVEPYLWLGSLVSADTGGAHGGAGWQVRPADTG